MKLYAWDNPWQVGYAGVSVVAVIAENHHQAMQKAIPIFSRHGINAMRIPIPDECYDDGVMAKEWSE